MTEMDFHPLNKQVISKGQLLPSSTSQNPVGRQNYIFKDEETEIQGS